MPFALWIDAVKTALYEHIAARPVGVVAELAVTFKPDRRAPTAKERIEATRGVLAAHQTTELRKNNDMSSPDGRPTG
jgi:hypothetical protein